MEAILYKDALSYAGFCIQGLYLIENLLSIILEKSLSVPPVRKQCLIKQKNGYLPSVLRLSKHMDKVMAIMNIVWEEGLREITGEKARPSFPARVA